MRIALTSEFSRQRYTASERRMQQTKTMGSQMMIKRKRIRSRNQRRRLNKKTRKRSCKWELLPNLNLKRETTIVRMMK